MLGRAKMFHHLAFKIIAYFGNQNRCLMNWMRKFFIPLILLLCAAPAYADIATEGEHDVYIELINGSDFPSYKFYIKSQSYYYEMGYQPGAVTTVYLEKGKHISTGDRGSSSLLYAEGKGMTYESKAQVGGATIDRTPGLNYLLDRIKVVRLKNKEIKFVVVERQLIGEDGKVIRTVQKGAVGSTGTQQIIMWVLPVVCMLGLLLFFAFRRRATPA